jgi:hypothetical protein
MEMQPTERRRRRRRRRKRFLLHHRLIILLLSKRISIFILLKNTWIFISFLHLGKNIKKFFFFFSLVKEKKVEVDWFFVRPLEAHFSLQEGEQKKKVRLMACESQLLLLLYLCERSKVVNGH